MDNNQFEITMQAAIDLQKSKQNVDNGIKSIGKSVNPIDVPFQFDLKNSSKLEAELNKIVADFTKNKGNLIDFKVNTSNVFDKDLGRRIEQPTSALLKYKNELNEVITTELKWIKIGSQIDNDGKESAIMGWAQATGSYRQNVEQTIKLNEKLLAQEKQETQSKSLLVEKMKLLNTQALKANIGLNAENQANFDTAIKTGNIKDAQHYLSLARLEFQQLNAVMSKGLPENAIENLNKKIFDMDTGITMLGNKFKTLGNAIPKDLDARVAELKTQLIDVNKTDNPEERIKKYNALVTSVQKLNNEYKVLNQETRIQNKDDKLELNKANLLAKIDAWVKHNSKALPQFGTKIDEVKAKIKSADAVQLKNLNKQFSTISKSAQAAGVAGKTFATKIKENIVQFARFTISATALMSVLNGFRSIISTVNELDKSLVDLQMATGANRQEAAKLLDTYNVLASELGATTKEVADAAGNWLRQGKSIADTNELIRASMILSKVGQIDSAQATQFLTSATKGYRVAVQDTIGVVDKLTAVDLVSATSAGGLAEGMSRVATSADLAGVSMDKLLSYLAIIGETTQKDMSEVGQSLQTMFSRMGNIKLGKLTDDETGESLSDVETAVKNLGINLRSNAGTFRSFSDVLDEIALKWSSLSDVERNSLGVAIAGTRQRENFTVLMTNYSKSLEYAETAANSSGTAMKKFQDYENSTEAATKRLTAQFEKLALDTLDSSVVRGFLNTGTAVLKLVDAVGGLIPVLIAAGSALLSLKFPTIAQGLSNVIIGLLNLKVVAGGTAVAFGAMTVSAQAFAATVTMGLSVAIMGAVAVFNKLNVTLEEQKQKVVEANASYEESKSKLESITQELDKTNERIKELQSKLTLTFVEQEELGKLQAITKELLIQKDLAEKEEARKAKELSQESTEQYNKQYGDNEFSQTNVNQKIADANIFHDINNLLSDEYDISALLAGYHQINELINEAVSNGNTEEANRYNEILDDTKAKLDSNAKSLLEIKNNLEKIPLKERSQEQNEIIDNANKGIELIYKITDPTKWNRINFESIFNADDFTNAKDKLLELAQAGKLDESNITQYQEFNDLIAKTGMTASDIVNEINSLATVTNSLKDSTYNLADAATAIKTLKDATSELVTANDEMNKSGAIQYSTMQSLIEKYPDLIRAINIENGVITISKKALEDKFNIESAGLSTTLQKMLTANSAKIESTKLVIEALKKEMELYGDTSYASKTRLFNASQELNGLQEDNEALTNVLETLGNASLDSYSKLSSSASKSADKIPEAFTKAYEKLQYERDHDIIDQETYLNRLEKLNTQFFSNDIENWRKYELEIYKGHKELREKEKELRKKELDEREKVLKAQGSAYISGIDKKIDRLNKKLERKKQYYDDRIKDLQDQKKEIQDQEEEQSKLLAIEKARAELAKAQSQSTIQIYRKNKGFVWEEDHEAVSQAKSNLDSAQKAYDNWVATKEIDDQIENYQRAKDEAERSIKSQIDKWNRLKSTVQEDIDNIGLKLSEHQEQTKLTAQVVSMSYNQMAASVREYAAALAELASARDDAANAGSKKKKPKSPSSGRVIKKRATGDRDIAISDFYNTNEFGKEELIREPATGTLEYLKKGTTIFSGGQTDTLWKMSKNPMDYIAQSISKLTTPKLSLAGVGSSVSNVSINLGNITLPNVTDANSFMSELKNIRLKAIQKKI